MPMDRKVIASACAVALALAAAFYLTQRTPDGRSTSPLASVGIAGPGDDPAPSGATIAELEQRIRVLEDIVLARSRSARRARPNTRDSGTKAARGTDLVTGTLEAAMKRQAEFDAEAGARSRKGATAETSVASALKAVVAAEQRYQPLESSQPECRRTMCKMQYRYANRSTAEYASTMLLMELNRTFNSSDVMVLPNDDGSYELLVYSRLK